MKEFGAQLRSRITDEAAAGIRKCFAEAKQKKTHADHNVEAGREFVAAQVEYVHYVEGLHQAAQGAGHHHEAPQNAAPERHAHEAANAEHRH